MAPGDAVLRVKTDMTQNPALRDWPGTVQTILTQEWQCMESMAIANFQSAVEDHLQGVRIIRGRT